MAVPVQAADPAGTARLWVDYQLGSQPHSAMFRYHLTEEAAAAVGPLEDLLTAHRTLFGTNWTTVGARVAAGGYNVTNDLPFAVITGNASGSVGGADAARSVSFVGRGNDGHKVRWYWYGVYMSSTPTDYRFTGEEHAAVAAFLDDFITFATDTGLVTITSVAPTIRPWANVAYNAYHQKRARG